MDTTKDSGKGRANQPVRRGDLPHPDDVELGEGKLTAGVQAADTGPGGQTDSQQPEDVPDAVPRREYQGAGVMNKQRRFGSSTRPEDLTREADQDREKGKKH